MSKFTQRDNFPVYGDHKCLVRNHLNLEVSLTAYFCISYHT